MNITSPALPKIQLSTHLISVKGRAVPVPCLHVDTTKVVATGRFLRVACIHDEEWLEQTSLPDPELVIESLKRHRFSADLFSFSQRPPDVVPRYSFPMESDNSAMIAISTYKQWWDQLPQVARRNVRTSEKKGITVRVVPFDDEFVRGIVSIYNEAPVRLGKSFWHYGKDFATVHRENSTYLERSTFIGAYFEGALIGFIKLVAVDRIGSMMQILSMIKHQDKRTTNALIAKAVEVCESKGLRYLMYCKYVYGTNESSLLTDFKKRNGFERVVFPRYYVPLTTKGRLAARLGAQHGIRGMIPSRLFNFALHLRAKYYSLKEQRSGSTAE